LLRLLLAICTIITLAAPAAEAAGGAACANPARAEGIVIYNADFHTLQYCDGDAWIPVGSAGQLSSNKYWSDWLNISAGSSTTCGVRSNGTAWCWGGGSSGQLGDGTTTTSQTTPVQVGTSGTSTLWSDWQSVSAGSTICGIRSNGTAWCWGFGSSGQRGDGATTATQTTPVQVGTAGTKSPAARAGLGRNLGK
jgi:alpha-tubulin suppressor-like RCC1 family protein